MFKSHDVIATYMIVLWLGGFAIQKGTGTIRGCPTISGAICIDQNTFALCDTDGLLTEDRFNCAIGSICSENSSEICKALHKKPPPSCNKNCGKCRKTKRFACISKNKFALCLRGDYPGGMIYTCPKNTVCSSTKNTTDTNDSEDQTQFCHDELTIVKPDCC